MIRHNTLSILTLQNRYRVHERKDDRQVTGCECGLCQPPDGTDESHVQLLYTQDKPTYIVPIQRQVNMNTEIPRESLDHAPTDRTPQPRQSLQPPPPPTPLLNCMPVAGSRPLAKLTALGKFAKKIVAPTRRPSHRGTMTAVVAPYGVCAIFHRRIRRPACKTQRSPTG